jgi:hypothetical protein
MDWPGIESGVAVVTGLPDPGNGLNYFRRIKGMTESSAQIRFLQSLNHINN